MRGAMIKLFYLILTIIYPKNIFTDIDKILEVQLSKRRTYHQCTQEEHSEAQKG